jgi:hypothetical protein
MEIKRLPQEISTTNIDNVESDQTTAQTTSIRNRDAVEVYQSDILQKVLTLPLFDAEATAQKVIELLDQLKSSYFPESTVSSFLSQLSPEQFKAVMQALVNSGKFDSVIHEMAQKQVNLGQVLGGFLEDAQNDPEMLSTIQMCLDSYGYNFQMVAGLVDGCQGNSELMKILPESTLLQLMGPVKGSSLWGQIYQALESKGISAAGHDVLMDETMEYLNFLADLDPAWQTGNHAFETLQALNPDDFKQIVEQLASSGKLSTLLDHIIANGKPEALSAAGKILGLLLDHAQNDPEMLQIVEQRLQNDFLSATYAKDFVASTNAQSLSLLPHDTLMSLMDQLEGKPEWATVFNALSIQESASSS